MALSAPLALCVVGLGTATVVLLALAVGTARLQLLPDLSGNLAPQISAGSLVVLRPVPVASLSRRDVIALSSSRIRGATELGLIMSLGRSSAEVRLATAGSIGTGPIEVRLSGPSVASVWLTVPWVGYAASWCHSALGEAVVAGVLLLLASSLALRRRPGARGRGRHRTRLSEPLEVDVGREP